MVTNHSKDGHQPSKIYHKEVFYRLLQNQDLVNCHGWSATIPMMVTHHPKDGHPQAKIYQKEEYYRLEIWSLDLTHKIKTR